MFIRNRKGLSLAEMMAVTLWGAIIGITLVAVFGIFKNTYFRSSSIAELNQGARLAIGKIYNELSQSASGKISIYKCPSDLCNGGVIEFQTPVTTSDPISGSIFKPSALAEKPIKWGYDGLETSEKIIYMVPGSTGYFSAYPNQLIRLTKKRQFAGPAVCPDGMCISPENNESCAADCFCDNGTCDSDEGSWNCPRDCYTGADCGNGFCGVGEDIQNCSTDCFCKNGTCDKGEMTISPCPEDCGGAFLIPAIQENQYCRDMDLEGVEMSRGYNDTCKEDALDNILGVGCVYAQGIPSAPDISGYNYFTMSQDNSYYDIEVISSNVAGIYFLGTPGPGTGGNAETKPTFVQIYLSLTKTSFASGTNQAFASEKVWIRNVSN